MTQRLKTTTQKAKTTGRIERKRSKMMSNRTDWLPTRREEQLSMARKWFEFFTNGNFPKWGITAPEAAGLGFIVHNIETFSSGPRVPVIKMTGTRRTQARPARLLRRPLAQHAGERRPVERYTERGDSVRIIK
jgi:hypothetical protein